ARRGRPRRGRGCCDALRSHAAGRDPAHLAVPARSAHRRLRAHHFAIHRSEMIMPAEWAAHRATWIAWPHNRTDWPGKLAPIPWVYGEVVRHLARHERVGILVADSIEERNARRVLTKVAADLGQIDFVRCPTDRVWT